MECLNSLGSSCDRQKIIGFQVAAIFQVTYINSAFTFESIFHDSPAAVGGYTLRTDRAVHSKTWHYVHANTIDIEHDDKSRPMLIPTNNYPMAMDAVGFPVIWRDSP